MKMKSTTTLLVLVGAGALVSYQLWLPNSQHKEPTAEAIMPQVQFNDDDAAPLPGSQVSAGSPASLAVAAAQTKPVRKNTADTDHMMMPEPVSNQPPLEAEAIQLWEADSTMTTTVVNGIRATPLVVDAEVLKKLQVGQMLELPIPSLNTVLSADIASTHNQLGNVKVWQGPISGGEATDNVIITQGDISTVVVVSTNLGIFTTTIDNATGQAAMVDEADVNAGMVTRDDTRSVEPIELTPPSADAS